MIFSHESPEYRDNVKNKNQVAFFAHSQCAETIELGERLFTNQLSDCKLLFVRFILW